MGRYLYSIDVQDIRERVVNSVCICLCEVQNTSGWMPEEHVIIEHQLLEGGGSMIKRIHAGFHNYESAYAVYKQMTAEPIMVDGLDTMREIVYINKDVKGLVAT